MATEPQANRTLWKARDDAYAQQRDALLRVQKSIARLASAHPEVVRDPMAREALRDAIARQDGTSRYAESQLARAGTTRAYWEQRKAGVDAAPPPLPRPLIPRTTGPPPRPRAAMPARVPEDRKHA